MKTIDLENGSLTLTIENNYMGVVNNVKNGEYVCAININQLANKENKEDIAIGMMVGILGGLVRNGYLKAADEVRAIIKGMEIGFNF